MHYNHSLDIVSLNNDTCNTNSTDYPYSNYIILEIILSSTIHFYCDNVTNYSCVSPGSYCCVRLVKSILLVAYFFLY